MYFKASVDIRTYTVHKCKLKSFETCLLQQQHSFIGCCPSRFTESQRKSEGALTEREREKERERKKRKREREQSYKRREREKWENTVTSIVTFKVSAMLLSLALKKKKRNLYERIDM
jgi:flagellar biosynthesis component FlhA